jgi:hypothetical protein
MALVHLRCHLCSLGHIAYVQMRFMTGCEPLWWIHDHFLMADLDRNLQMCVWGSSTELNEPMKT